MIRIFWTSGESTEQYDVQELESSYRYRAIMQKPTLVLKFSLSEYVEFPVGAQCVYQNETYTLLSPANIKKNGVRSIEYTLTMGGDEEHLSKYKLRNNEDGRLKWSMTATPAEFIRQIVLNLNARDGEGVWSVGACLEATEKTIEFNHSYLLDALNSVAEEFETEWEISGHVISLHKVEYFKDDPVALSYGKGNGFVPALGRTSSSGEPPVEVLYVQGGDKNIDRSKYGSQFLLLPKSQEFTYEGRTYKSSADGLSIQRADKEPQYNNEDSLELTEIYPSRIGKVTSVETESVDKHFYNVIDNTIPESLDYNNYLIAGDSMTIIFQSGMLAGREFELKYKHSARRFEIVPNEYDGVTMPSETFKPAVGDTYAIFGVMLPDAYICDNETQTGASWDMFKEACRYLYENEDQKFTFTGELQGIWAKRNWLEVGGKLKVGGYVHFSDTQFAPDGVDIRITGIKDYIYNPYAPVIELSNEVTGSSVSSAINHISQQEVVIDNNHKNALQFTKRMFRDAQETLGMLEGALADFSGGINPVSIQTMAMLVGDESLQFVFLSASHGSVIVLSYVYNDTTKKLTCPHVWLRHMTLGIDTLSASHDISEFKEWEIEAYESPVLTDDTKKYYLYVKCPTDTTQKGTFLLSESIIGMEDVQNYYHFLVGILNSEYDGSRSFAALYGFTEILPARVTTDRIVSADGKNFFDLVGNALHLGDAADTNYLDWNNEQEGTLVMSNAYIKNALKVIGEALIAGFKFTDDIIKSVATAMQGSTEYPAFYLDGRSGRIELRSSGTGGDYSLDTISSTISLDAQQGDIVARNDNGVSYVSASGIFSNNPKTNALPSSSGYTRYGSIVGLGFGRDINQSEWALDREQTIVVGVYGSASNSGTARAFGGYFNNLKAAGLVLNLKYITDDAATTSVTLSALVSQVVGLTNSGNRGVVYLPNDDLEGKVIWAKQFGKGSMRFYPQSGQHIYDDDTENEYYDAGTGYELKFTYARWVKESGDTSVNVQGWLVCKYSF